MTVLRLAIPCPLRRLFDYLPPADCDLRALVPGVRVEVPFGSRRLVGVLIELAQDSDVPAERLRAAHRVLDAEAVLPPVVGELVSWAAAYYHYPLGECLHQALPALLRKGESLHAHSRAWRLSREGRGLPADALRRAPRQAQALTLLRNGPVGEEELNATGIRRTVLLELQKKSLLEAFEQPLQHGAGWNTTGGSEAALEPGVEQRDAIAGVEALLGASATALLEGITGSGKTEVYLQLIQRCLDRDQQVLVLVPEIGLTPQTLARFQRRFGDTVALMHSGRNDGERLEAWRAARAGSARILLGTRSAVFTPFHRLGLIVVDEEHDSSFKQQESFRYSARDLAVKRGQLEGCPVLLGSATPSLESLNNALAGRYLHLRLSARAGGAAPPSIDLVDIRRVDLDEGFSPDALAAIGLTLEREEQVLVFINRRGFSPALLCHDCGWVGQCRRCDARLTVHLAAGQLRCHHCDDLLPLPRRCPSCDGTRLDLRGPGSERCERALARHFPGTPLSRIDRDTTTTKTALTEKLAAAQSGGAALLVGTQMLAKGHHLPGVTLVVVVDVDSALFSPDFRGAERMAQLLEQVAGRAGRAERPGRVLIQTHHPEHPLLNQLIDRGYGSCARALLEQRRRAGLPPFSHQALLRAEAGALEQAEAFLHSLVRQLPPVAGVNLHGPLPAPMARRAGRFRAQLLLSAASRAPLHRQLEYLCELVTAHPQANRLRWSLDVDPQEAF